MEVLKLAVAAGNNAPSQSETSTVPACFYDLSGAVALSGLVVLVLVDRLQTIRDALSWVALHSLFCVVYIAI